MDIKDSFIDFVKEALLDYKDLSTIQIKSNECGHTSIYAITKETIYYPNSSNFLARIKLGKRVSYIGFHALDKKYFDRHKIEYFQVNSEQSYIRVSFNIINSLLSERKTLSVIINEIFINSFNLEEFGCCHRYLDCSNSKKCIHPNLICASACQYKKNLIEGRIFYGINRNA